MTEKMRLTLNTQVAEKVMGWTKRDWTNDDGAHWPQWCDENGFKCFVYEFNPASNIACAFRAIERMRELGYAFSIFGLPRHSSLAPHQMCIFQKSVRPPAFGNGLGTGAFRGAGDTFPESICIAALHAINNVEVQ